MSCSSIQKANPYHDPKTGRFTTGPSSGGKISSPGYVGNYKDPVGSYTHTEPMSGRQIETLFYKREDNSYDVVEFDQEDDTGYWTGSVSEEEYRRHMTAYAGNIWSDGKWVNPHRLQAPKTPKYVVAKSEKPSMSDLTKVLKFNPYHDPKTGRFSSRGMAGGSGGATTLRSAVDDQMAAYVKRAPRYGTPLPNAAEYDQKILAAESAGDKKLAKKLRDDLDRAQVEFRGMVRANDLKKGSRVLLRNGWEADLIDNGRGNTRTAKVYGDYTEIGSVYTKDILEAKVGVSWRKVALSDAQRKAAKKIRAAGW